MRKYKSCGFRKLVKILAFAKVLSVYGLNKEKFLGNEIIAGFDTMVICDKKIIQKPRNKQDAVKKILFLSNKTHKVITGIGILDLKKEKIILDAVETKVTMKKITKEDARTYTSSGEPLGKAGAYAIQGKGKKFVNKVSGDYLNVVGLPLKRFLQLI